MRKNRLGKTALNVSTLGFGCGAVGGLMIRGTSKEQERAVARAVELGINYFDTAAAYGSGISEQNLGCALATLSADVMVGTKVWVPPKLHGGMTEAIAASLDASLQRLQRDHVDLFQLHNPIVVGGGNNSIDPRSALDEIAYAFKELQRQGKVRYFGFSAIGETMALHTALDAGIFDTVQVIYNLLNASAGDTGGIASGQDFDGLLGQAAQTSTGVIAIRILAGGALSGGAERHPYGLSFVEPMGTGSIYSDDMQQARRFMPLVREGHVDSLVEASVRFAISNSMIATSVIGFSSIDQLEYAVAASRKGALSAATLSRICFLEI